MDTVSPETRSRVMARVRSQRNRSTEWRLRACLIRAGIRGWKLNPPDIHGKPDFAFREQRLLLFVDGCYWHGCPKCYRRPSSNMDYWDAKVTRYRSRDAKTTAQL
jgi:DNA mismatch endonuclease (patch repair protein)